MKIGIIQTGNVRGELAATFGEYPAMFGALLTGADPALRLETHAVVNGDPLPDPEAADAWLVTGSGHGVYDDLPWIAATRDFLRAARAARRPLVGVCFGHQLFAEAFGGRAIKHPGGWRLGAGPFAVTAPPVWARDLPRVLTLHSVHQDQVVAIPDDASVWTTADGCAYAGLLYGDPAAPDAISIQPHPEIAAPYARALTERLVADGRVDPGAGAAALASIGAPVDNAAVGRLFADYLRRAGA